MSPSRRAQRVVVIGASFAGLFAAAAVAAAGVDVVLVERDVLGDEPEPRHGVPQGRQPHVLLQRGALAVERLLPGLTEELLAAGAHRLNTGGLPWLSGYGWMPTDYRSYDIFSISRPLLELLVRRRVQALPRVSLRQGTRVDALDRSGADWEVHLADGDRLRADVVIDASGRGSRLPHWLTRLGYPPPTSASVEAHLGYASRRFRDRHGVALRTGVVMLATPEAPRGALALPIEDGRWLVLENGYGDQRPGRDEASFDQFLTRLPDPALHDLVAELEPDGDVAVHRQTGNQRRDYGRRGEWPQGLLAVGDSLCAFNPLYGQGITVAACQAEILTGAVRRLASGRSTRRWQRRLVAITDFPWAIATSEDHRYIAGSSLGRLQRLTSLWTERMSWLAVGGDRACLQAFADAYHLMGPPARMFGPRVAASILRSIVRGLPAPAPRPPILDALRASSST